MPWGARFDPEGRLYEAGSAFDPRTREVSERLYRHVERRGSLATDRLALPPRTSSR